MGSEMCIRDRFRGFPNSPETFEKFTTSFGGDFMTYMGGGYKRRTINEGGDKSIMSVNYYLGSEEQSKFSLPLHGEMYYIKRRPELMWFYCVCPAESEGETTVCDGEAILAGLKPSTRDLFANQRLRYIRYYPDGEWQKRFQTDDLDAIEEFAHANDMSIKIDKTARTVHTEYYYPAVVEGKWSGAPAFINNILPVVWQEVAGKKDDNIVRLEDGSKIPDEVVAELQQVSDSLTRLIEWQPADIAMVDNTRVLHGRRAFSDERRQIYSRMVRELAW